MFTIDVLPARHGDCLWIEYGDGSTVNRVLIDGGTVGTANNIKQRLDDFADDAQVFELGIITHIDADHISGLLRLFEDDAMARHFRDVWFNAWKHLLPEQIEEEGPVQGEKLSAILRQSAWSWNGDFDGKRVATVATGELPQLTLPGGLKITLLSPRPEDLFALQGTWKKEVEKAGMAPGIGMEESQEEDVPSGLESFGDTLPDVEALAASAFEPDGSKANGSSIAVMVEYNGVRALLAGDAHAEVLLDALDRLPSDHAGNGRLALDLFKLPHHGSRANINRQLLERLDCRRYVFSTSGAYFRHPDPEAVAKVIRFGGANPELCFNYRNKYTRVWDKDELKLLNSYTTRYPANEGESLRIALQEN